MYFNKLHCRIILSVQLIITLHWFKLWLLELPGNKLLPESMLALLRLMTHIHMLREAWVHFCFDPFCFVPNTLQWLQCRHNRHDGVWNLQPYDCLFNHFIRRRSQKTSKLRVTGLCEGNSPVTGEFPAQRASNAENVSIWWRHYVTAFLVCLHTWQMSKSLHKGQ